MFSLRLLQSRHVTGPRPKPGQSIERAVSVSGSLGDIAQRAAGPLCGAQGLQEAEAVLALLQNHAWRSDRVTGAFMAFTGKKGPGRPLQRASCFPGVLEPPAKSGDAILRHLRTKHDEG